MKQTMHEAIRRANADPLRPTFHFSAPANWMNDPNGTIYHNGKYHLFYQFNPEEPKWGNIHWGQAVSENLVHWEHLPIALKPDRKHREKHCFSGCCVMNAELPNLFYTSIGGVLGLLNVIRGAAHWRVIGDENFTNWKRPEKPVFISQKHHQRKVYQWRDPYIWFEKDHWEMVIVGKYFGEKFGSVFRYLSYDLENWEFCERWIKGDSSLGNAWECPNVLSFDKHKVVLISPFSQVIYAIGDSDSEKFKTNEWNRLDHGKDFYATNTYLDAEGYVVVGWVRCRGKAWAGCLSLPRRVWLGQDGMLRQAPVKQTQMLRKKEIVLEKGKDISICGTQLEIIAVFDLYKENRLGFQLSCGEENFKVCYDVFLNCFTCLNEDMPLQHTEGLDQLSLHIFIDHSVIEVFINEREVFTTWVTPKFTEGEWKLEILEENKDSLINFAAWELNHHKVNQLGDWLNETA